MMDSSQWQLIADHQAAVQSDYLSFEIDLEQPVNGLVLKNRPLQANLFQLNIANSSELPDYYLRGNDLVTTFQEDSIRRQVYWKSDKSIIDSKEYLAIEVTLSSQTSQLGSKPIVTSQSNIEGGEILQLVDAGTRKFNSHVAQSNSTDFQKIDSSPACFLIRTTDNDLSYVEMIHPADYQRSEYLISKNQCSLRHQLFGDDLEKGVIIQARMQGAFIPRKSDEATAVKYYQAFVNSKISLTT